MGGLVELEDMDAQEHDQLKSCYLGTGKAFSVQHKHLPLINIQK